MSEWKPFYELSNSQQNRRTCNLLKKEKKDEEELEEELSTEPTVQESRQEYERENQRAHCDEIDYCSTQNNNAASNETDSMPQQQPLAEPMDDGPMDVADDHDDHAENMFLLLQNMRLNVPHPDDGFNDLERDSQSDSDEDSEADSEEEAETFLGSIKEWAIDVPQVKV